MNQLDYSMDEYQANVLRTANKEINWHQTVENCLLGLIGELGELIETLNPSNNEFLMTFIQYAKVAETIKKAKYHGKLIENTEENHDLIKLASIDTNFLPNPSIADGLKKELGDVLYYHTWLIDTLGHELGDVAQLNVEKLRKRYATGYTLKQSLERKE